jgi:cytochrome c-type biogenesis protein
VPEKIAVAFLAGLVSVVSPCVLPLVPGYLSAISALEVTRLNEPGAAARVVRATVPFVTGFTIVFVLVGAGAASLGGLVDENDQQLVAGFVLVVLGLAFVGVLPWPERVVGAGLLQRARARGSNVLLGSAFAVAAAPCIGLVLGSILVLASDSGTVVRGIFLLTAYSLGLGTSFLLAGLAFTRAMGAFRWVRDRYAYLRVGGGLTLVVLGLLLFFERDWWMYVFLNRLFESIGIDRI